MKTILRLLGNLTATGLLLIFSLTNATAQWQQTKGPGAGNISEMIADADNNLYLGCSGGIYFSDDAGQSWSLRVNGMNPGLNVEYLDTMGSTIFAAGGDPGNSPLYMSTDNGANWTNLSANLPAFYFYGLEHIGNRLLMPAGDGLYYSDDMGQSWDTLSTYLISSDSTPNPSVWSALVLGDDIYAFVYNSGLYRTSDMGDTWEHVDGNYEPQSQPTAIVSSGSALFLSHPESSSESYRSLDNGANWSVMDACGGSCPIQKFYFHDGVLYGCTGFGLYTSTDNGDTWNIDNSLPSPEEYKGILYTNGTWITATNIFGPGIYRSTNDGFSWDLSNDGYAGSRVMALLADGSSLFASDYELGMMATTDGGDTYESIDNPNIFEFYSGNELVKSGSYMYLGGYSRVFRTNDGGDSWEQVVTGLPFIFDALDMMVDGTDILIGTQSGLYRSTNGTNWTAVGGTGLPAGLEVRGICRKGNRLFITGQVVIGGFEYFGRVFYSDDNGVSWNDVSTQFNFTAYSSAHKIHVKGNNILLATNSGIYISTDNGITFTPVTNGISAYSVGNPTRFREYGSHVYANGPGGVFASSDNGLSWASITDNLFNPWVHDMAFVDNMIYVGTEWGGIWKRPVSDITVGIVDAQQSTVLQIYPNPASSEFTIHGKVGERLSVFNTTGQMVYNQTLTTAKATIASGCFASGIYTVRLSNDNGATTSKLIITN